MTVRRVLWSLALLLPALLVTPDPVEGQMGVPTSVGLVHHKQKIFKPGDWVFYEVHGTNMQGESSVDYQRVQVGLTPRYRGEDCFWLETGWGRERDTLTWSAALVSEGIFEDSLAEVRANAYLRMLHITTDDHGVPLAAETRMVNPKDALGSFPSYKPTYVDAGLDTVETPKGPIVCRVVEITKVSHVARDMPDSTLQQTTESKTRRWMNTELVPITGIVREEETKTFSKRIWPLGKPSTDFPPHVEGIDTYRIELLDFGHGAKPMISDRIRHSRERAAAPAE